MAILNGRIIKGVGGLYAVQTEDGVYSCQARGLFRKQKKTPLVGDIVEILTVDEEKRVGYLQKILERKNELLRPRVANVDQVVLVFAAAAPSLHLDLLDRLIVLIERQRLDIVLCINKVDLADAAFCEGIRRIYGAIGYRVLCVSAVGAVGIDFFYAALRGKISVLAGPSGVGKSSLMARLFPDRSFAVGSISRKIERGRHTTRHTEFLPLAEGGYIADTPGFTSLEIDAVRPEEFQYYFKEFAPFLGRCRFADCVHHTEPDCAVKAAVGTVVAPSRYDSYIRFLGDKEP